MSLRSAFDSFLDCFRQSRDIVYGKQSEGSLTVLLSRREAILRVVELAESGMEFSALLDESHALAQKVEDEMEGPRVVQWLVELYLRQSGLYVRLFDGCSLSDEEEFQRFEEALIAEDETVRYMAPLAFLQFAQEKVDFGDFWIQKFPAAELEEIFSNRARNIFYPSAELDIGKLANYWFLCAEATLRREAAAFVSPHLGGQLVIPRMEVSPSSFCLPTPIDRAFSCMALLDWSPLDQITNSVRITLVHGQMRLARPVVPCVFEVRRLPRRAPSAPPSSRDLFLETDYGSATVSAASEDLFDMRDPGNTQRFAQSIREVLRLVRVVESVGDQWAFLTKALAFMARAFASFTEEQLLWNVTAIEALFGENVNGLVKLLRDRVAAVLGTTDASRKEIKKRFDAVYDMRSALVHGASRTSESLFVTEDARLFARTCLLWMLHCACHIRQLSPDATPLPTRKQILRLLDTELAVRQLIERLSPHLPATFPSIAEWHKVLPTDEDLNFPKPIFVNPSWGPQ